MLILTRKGGESIKVGDDVKITILEIKGNQVRIGIQAPKKVSVHREEVYNLIKASNVMAADQTPDHLDDVRSIWQTARRKQ